MVRRPGGGGFTLIELLVVLTIIGLFLGLVSTIARPDERAVLRVEAERLAQLLDLAAEESRLTGKSIGWTGDGPGYRFWRISDNAEWSEIRDGDLLRARTLPQGMAISSLRVENARPQGEMRLVFSPYGPTPAFMVEIAIGARRYSVAGSPTGDVRAVPAEGATHAAMALR